MTLQYLKKNRYIINVHKKNVYDMKKKTDYLLQCSTKQKQNGNIKASGEKKQLI